MTFSTIVGGLNGPFLCGKETTFEGGLHEPGIAWWPGSIPAGTVSRQSATVMDFMATLADFANLSVPSDRQLDSMSLREPLTQGKETVRCVMSYNTGYCTIKSHPKVQLKSAIAKHS